jgi:hypothetical protein
MGIVAVLAVVVGLCPAVVAGDAEVRLEAELTGANGVSGGKAKFEHRPGDRTKISVQVEDVLLASTVEVTLGGDATRHALTLVGGFGDLNLDSRRDGSLPMLAEGDAVVVFASGTTTRIMEGTFSPK